MSIANESRIKWIDIAKGYGLICVILGHCLDGGNLRFWFYTFHMPLFFFLSGYVFSTKADFKTFLKKKCKSIVVPYFSLGLVILIAQGLLAALQPPAADSAEVGGSTADFVIEWITAFLVQERLWTLWYIAALLWVNLIMYAIIKNTKRWWVALIWVLAITAFGLGYAYAGGPILPWNLDASLVGIFFFYGGYLAKTYQEKAYKLLWLGGKMPKAIPFFVWLAVNIFFGFLNKAICGEGIEMYYSEYGIFPLTFISAFAGIAFVIILSKATAPKFINYVGENTLVYYAWHQSVVLPFVQMFLWSIGLWPGITNNWLQDAGYYACEFVLIMLILTALNAIVIHTPFKYMVGRGKLIKC